MKRHLWKVIRGGICLGSIVAFGFFPSLAMAGLGEWTATGTLAGDGQPEGGTVNALDVDPSNPTRLLAATPDGIYLTEDDTATWESVFDKMIYDVDIASKDGQTVYAIGNAIYKSMDGGHDWTTAYDLQNKQNDTPYRLAVDPLNPAVVYVMTLNCRVFKSIDGGVTWANVSEGIASCDDEYHLDDIEIDPTDPDILYLGAGNAAYPNALPNKPDFYVSTDGGLHWQPKPIDVDFDTIGYIGVSTDGTLYVPSMSSVLKSVDQGDTWTTVNDSVSDLGRITPDPVVSGRLYAVSDAGIARSDDGGLTWSTSTEGLTSTWLSDFAFDGNNPDTVFISTVKGGVFESADGGVTWAPRNKGIFNITINAIQVNPANGDWVYVGTDGNGVFTTQDGGATWNRSNKGIATAPSGSIWVTALTEDPLNPKTLYVATVDDHIYKSVDGASQWQQSDNGIPSLRDAASPGYVDCLAIDPQTDAVVYAGTIAGGLYKSADGGTSWVQVGGQVLGKYIRTVVIDSVSPTTVYVGTDAEGVFKSDDGGSTWKQVNAGLQVNSIWAMAIDPKNPQTLYASVENADIYKTTDGGQSWTYMSKGIPGGEIITSIVVDSNNPATVLAGTLGDGVYITHDGGATWTAMSAGLDDNQQQTQADERSPDVAAYRGTESTSGTQDSNLMIYTLGVAQDGSGLSYAGTAGGKVFSYTRTSESVSGSDPSPEPTPAKPVSNGGGGGMDPLLMIFLLISAISQKRREYRRIAGEGGAAAVQGE